MSERTLLTPAEAVLLIDPDGSAGTKCVQASLISLVAAGHLAVREQRGFFSTKRALVAGDTPAPEQPLPPHVMAVKKVVEANSFNGVLERDSIGPALHSAFDESCRRYVHDHVAPGLERRGLLKRIDEKFLWLFNRIGYRRTGWGERLVEPLLRLRADLDKMPLLIRDDPAEALRIARDAGILLILSPQARGQIEELRKLLAEREENEGGGGGGGGGGDGGSTDQDANCGIGYNFGDFTLDMKLDALLYTIDAVGDCSDSNGDWGGDGGGGDGGGGD